jgi:hypothetical protein
MLALDFALIAQFGADGAAIASTLAYTFFGVVSFLALARVVDVSARSLVVPTRSEVNAYRDLWRRAVAKASYSR